MLSLSLLALLSGCAKPQTVYETVKQPHLPIPASLLTECPAPQIPEQMTYGDSVMLNMTLLDSLDDCNGKLRAISKINDDRIK
ncbi:peptidase [Kluyvera sp. Nf5]|nr:peptidase [Kluyvera sp. Nf5]